MISMHIEKGIIHFSTRTEKNVWFAKCAYISLIYWDCSDPIFAWAIIFVNRILAILFFLSQTLTYHIWQFWLYFGSRIKILLLPFFLPLNTATFFSWGTLFLQWSIILDQLTDVTNESHHIFCETWSNRIDFKIYLITNHLFIKLIRGFFPLNLTYLFSMYHLCLS